MHRRILWPVMLAALVGLSTGMWLRTRAPGEGVGSAAEEPVRNVAALKSLSTTYAEIVKAVTPAVVNVNSKQIIPGRVIRDPFFDMFGEEPGGGMFREPPRRAQSLGSGVIVDGRGIIVTNHHVIANANTITVTLKDKRAFPARLLGSDEATDVAVLKIDAQDLPVLAWANSDTLQVGDIVLAVGSPFNLASTVTQGIISAKGRRDLGISEVEDFLQTDAAINPGNSGGALVDLDGKLIGINSAILSESGGNQGIGLAIPSNLAKRISTGLITSGKIVRGWLGLVVQPVTEDLAATIGLQPTRGVMVVGVYQQSPAAKLPWTQQGNDVITAVNGTAVESPGQLRNLVAESRPGEELTLHVWANGKERDLKTEVWRRPERAQGV